MSLERTKEMTMKRWTYGKTRLGEVFVEWLGEGETPDWPHPEGKRWGLVEDDGEWLVYAGRVAAVVSPVRRKVTATVETECR